MGINRAIYLVSDEAFCKPGKWKLVACSFLSEIQV